MIAVLAQGVYRPSPTSVGLPGGAIVTDVLDWGMWVAIACILGAIIVGGVKMAYGAKSGSGVASNSGRSWVVGGLIGAVVVFGAPALVEFGQTLSTRL